MLIAYPLKARPSAVLVTASLKSMFICNRFHARRPVNNDF